MLDINLIREKPEYVKEALKKKLWDTDFTELLSWDKEKRELLKVVEDNKAEMNRLSASVPAAKKAGEDVSKIFMLAWAKGRRLSYWAFTLTSYCIQVLPVCCRSKVLISVGRV